MRNKSNMIDKLSLWGAYLSSFLIVSLVLLILIEIFMRHFFHSSTMIADEYSGYLYLSAIFLALGYTFSENAHIRINIISSRFGQTTNRFIDIIAGVIALFVLSFIFYRSILLVYDSYEFDMHSEHVSHTPIYLTQIVMPIGLALFILTMFIFVLKKIKNDK